MSTTVVRRHVSSHDKHKESHKQQHHQQQQQHRSHHGSKHESHVVESEVKHDIPAPSSCSTAPSAPLYSDLVRFSQLPPPPTAYPSIYPSLSVNNDIQPGPLHTSSLVHNAHEVATVHDATNERTPLLHNQHQDEEHVQHLKQHQQKSRAYLQAITPSSMFALLHTDARSTRNKLGAKPNINEQQIYHDAIILAQQNNSVSDQSNTLTNTNSTVLPTINNNNTNDNIINNNSNNNNGVSFIRHLVTANDDLVDLAVQYNTSVSQIRAHNRRVVFDRLDNVLGEYLHIPIGPGYAVEQKHDLSEEDISKLEEQNRINKEFEAIQAFKFNTNSNVSDAEALIYLESHSFDVSKACDEYLADIAWEREQLRAIEQAEKHIKSKTGIFNKFMQLFSSNKNKAANNSGNNAQAPSFHYHMKHPVANNCKAH